jgi:hypothetical protein
MPELTELDAAPELYVHEVTTIGADIRVIARMKH